MQVERSTTGVLGVEVHLECLPHRIRLDEVAFIVDMKPVMSRMVFQVRDETGDVDDGQRLSLSLPQDTNGARSQVTLSKAPGHKTSSPGESSGE